MGMCSSGQKQSPINIKKAELIHGKKSFKIYFDYLDPIPKVKFSFDGHYVMVFSLILEV